MEMLPGAAQFAALTRGADADLARCGLAIGRIIQPNLDPAPYLAMLEDYAQQVRARAATDDGADDAGPPQRPPSPTRLAEALRTVLFEDLGFRGDRDTYDDPANSYLHRVLEQRRGLPITLSIIVIDLGRRVGLPVVGVGTPGHFLVKFHDGRQDRFLDPFNAGRPVDRDALARGLAATPALNTMSAEAWLSGVTTRQMLARVLANLKRAHLQRREFPQALGAVDYHLAMNPWALDELRDRGLVQLELRAYDAALRDLRQYRAHAPQPADAARIDAVIARIEARHGDPDSEPNSDPNGEPG